MRLNVRLKALKLATSGELGEKIENIFKISKTAITYSSEMIC